MINYAINDAINEDLQSKAQQALSDIGMDVGELAKILQPCNRTAGCLNPMEGRCPCAAIDLGAVDQSVDHLEETLGLANIYYQRIVTSRSK